MQLAPECQGGNRVPHALFESLLWLASGSGPTQGGSGAGVGAGFGNPLSAESLPILFSFQRKASNGWKVRAAECLTHTHTNTLHSSHNGNLSTDHMQINPLSFNLRSNPETIKLRNSLPETQKRADKYRIEYSQILSFQQIYIDGKYIDGLIFLVCVSTPQSRLLVRRSRGQMAPHSTETEGVLISMGIPEEGRGDPLPTQGAHPLSSCKFSDRELAEGERACNFFGKPLKKNLRVSYYALIDVFFLG